MPKCRPSPAIAVAAPPANASSPRSPAAIDWRMRIGGTSARRYQKTMALTMSTAPAARPAPIATWQKPGRPAVAFTAGSGAPAEQDHERADRDGAAREPLRDGHRLLL